MDEEQYKDSTTIMQLLRDNITLWTQDLADVNFHIIWTRIKFKIGTKKSRNDKKIEQILFSNKLYSNINFMWTLINITWILQNRDIYLKIENDYFILFTLKKINFQYIRLC